MLCGQSCLGPRWHIYFCAILWPTASGLVLASTCRLACEQTQLGRWQKKRSPPFFLEVFSLSYFSVSSTAVDVVVALAAASVAVIILRNICSCRTCLRNVAGNNTVSR